MDNNFIIREVRVVSGLWDRIVIAYNLVVHKKLSIWVLND